MLYPDIAPGDEVLVKAKDYSYCGILAVLFYKKSGELRCVVEDYNGRLFIHNMNQISKTISTDSSMIGTKND
jgi:hypothetical protein